MRKRMYLIPVSQLLMLLCLMSSASPAFASSRQAATSRADLANAMRTPPGWHRLLRPIRPRGQENNQYHWSVVNHIDNKDYWGHDQGNSGNYGYNRGYNEDNSANTANQIINRGAAQSRRNNQHYHIFANDSGNLRYFGYRQGNSGNSGYNEGVNRDNSANIGNQIID